jgi:nicotinate-nucleotide pyrophosphorylase (carboxylating)
MPAMTALPAFPSDALERLLPLAFAEDEGSGDVTSLATIDEGAKGRARLLCKQAGVIAGLPAAEAIFSFRTAAVTCRAHRRDGDTVEAGDIVMDMEGSLRDLLVCERILLNFMQRMSGIATAAAAHARALAGSKTRLLDTRKTLPGYRDLDKYAVAVGGGVNHRRGLYDQILIKDNHAEACGSVRAAVDKARARYGSAYVVEAEVRTLGELETLLDGTVDIALLDNMGDADLAEAAALARARAPGMKLEASGNMDLARLARIRDIGMDFVSVGALTHSVKALDLSLDIVGAAHG